MEQTAAEMAPERWVIGVTGASGTVYARRLIEVLLAERPDAELHIVFSEAALRVMREEEGISTSVSKLDFVSLFGAEAAARSHLYNNRDIGAAIASGSFRTSGMVIVPCSMATLAAVACGFGDKLIHRAADVVLKERRKLIIVPRETPLSNIHLENMLVLSKAGAIVAPAMPGFYHRPSSISELVDMQVMKILDLMGCPVNLVERWEGKKTRLLKPAAAAGERED